MSEAPKVEKDSGLSGKERKSLEEQIAKLKRRHEESELKATLSKSSRSFQNDQKMIKA